MFRDWVYAAIRPICTRIAGQEIFIGRLMKSANPQVRPDRHFRKQLYLVKRTIPDSFKSMGDRIEAIEDHPVLETFRRPNPAMNKWQLVYSMVASLQLTGRAFLWIDTNQDGDINYWPVPSHWVTPVHEGDRLFSKFIVRPPDATEGIPVPGNRMMMIAFPDPSDPRRTYSPVQAGTRTILTDDALQESQHQSLKHGIWPKVVIKAGRLEDPRVGQPFRPVLTPDQRNQLQQAIKNAYAKPENHAEPVIVDGLIEEIMPFTRSPSEMDFAKSAEILKARIMQVTGTNPAIIGELAGVNRATAAVADGHFCKYSLNPVATLISEGLTHTVGPLFAAESEQLVLWIEKCQPADAEMTLKQWQIGAKEGAVTRNEYRVNVLNLEPLEDEELGEELLGAKPPAPEVDPNADPDADDGSERSEESEDDEPKKHRRTKARRTRSKQVGSQEEFVALAIETARQQTARLTGEMAKTLDKLFRNEVEEMIVKIGQVKPTREDELDPVGLATAMVDPMVWTQRLKTDVRKHLIDAALTGYATQVALVKFGVGGGGADWVRPQAAWF